MILENKISLWIQIAPFSIDGTLPPPPSQSISKYCDVFPRHFYSSNNNDDTDRNIDSNLTSNEIRLNSNSTREYYNFSYTLTGYSHQLKNGTFETIINNSLNREYCESDMKENISSFVSQNVEHIWFYHWDDFAIPESIFDEAINKITTRAAQYISQNKSIVISCYSGRGRLILYTFIII